MNQTDLNQDMGNVGKLTEQEAYELAETLKQKLAEKQIPDSNQESLKQMVAGLGDDRGALRLTFAQSLGSVGEAAIPILCDALKNSPNVIIRRASAKTLNLIGSKKALPNLLEAFTTDEDPVVQGSSAGAMATIGIPAIESLLTILTQKDCSAFQVGLINLALSFIGSKVPDAFNQATKSDHPEIRIAALTVLAEQIQAKTNPRAEELLLEAFQDQNSEVRAEAVTMAGKTLESSDVHNALTTMLQDQSAQVRKNTALSLMKMEAVESIEDIDNAISIETDEQVKAVMTVALNQLKRSLD